jgi:hypothetical protein
MHLAKKREHLVSEPSRSVNTRFLRLLADFGENGHQFVLGLVRTDRKSQGAQP